MKKALLITGIIISMVSLYAQQGTISLNLDAGYTFHDEVHFDVAYADVEAAFTYGGGLEYFTGFSNSVEVKYIRMDTYMPLYKPSGELWNTDHNKGSVNYVLVGGNNYFGSDPDSKARPYGGLGLGLGIISLDGNNATKFAWDAKLGVKIRTSSVVSVKLQAYMNSIISTFGSDVWYDPWGYPIAVPDYASLWQFGFSGILCFDFRR